MRQFYLLLIFVIASCWVSCSTNDVDNDTSMNNVEVLRNSILISSYMGDSISHFPMRVPGGGRTINIGILSVRIATKKSGCKTGFGLCDFKWFPKDPKQPTFDPWTPRDTTNVPNRPLTRFANTNAWKGSNGSYYTLLLLDKPLPAGLSHKDAYLEIDEDLFWVNDSVTVSEIPLVGTGEAFNVFKNEVLSHEYFMINKGNIEFDPSIGKYGGFIITITSDEK